MNPSGRFAVNASVALVFTMVLSCRADPGGEDVLTEARDKMVEYDLKGRGIHHPDVLAAMSSVPRHEFVPPEIRTMAYADGPLPIGLGQTISQPYIVAAMTELLEPQSGHVVLEVGTGSGYQAAILGELVAQVYTVEIVPDLGKQAEETLTKLGYTNITVRIGDGYAGWSEVAPFDGIIVTCGAEDIPPPLIEQLKPGGRMVIPVGPFHQVQELMLLEKDLDGTISRRSVMLVRFVPMTGEAMSRE